MPLSASSSGSTLSESLGWEAWSGNLNLSQAAMGQVAIPPAGLELEVNLNPNLCSSLSKAGT